MNYSLPINLLRRTGFKASLLLLLCLSLMFFLSPAVFAEGEADLNFTVGGQTVTRDTVSLDLTAATPEEVDRLISALPSLTQLRNFELGSAYVDAPTVSWEQLSALRQGAPLAAINYRLTVQGYSFLLSDEILNLNHISFDDNGDLAVKIASCMPNLRVLDMDSCGVSNQRMAEIRDMFPSAEVVWRVWIGTGYSCRTNVTRLVISNPDRGGDLDTDAAIEGLFYCTKVKYLDLGHNYHMSDISFLYNMPDLEVLILAMTAVRDCSPLAACPKLNYLEYQTSAACDLRPLAELHELKDLNICYNFALRDIRPLYGLDLDRLYIGCISPVPEEQIREYRRLHPSCMVNTTTEDPTEENWRVGMFNDEWAYAPRYAQLRLEFEYDNFPGCYAYTENDPRWGGRFEYDSAYGA